MRLQPCKKKLHEHEHDAAPQAAAALAFAWPGLGPLSGIPSLAGSQRRAACMHAMQCNAMQALRYVVRTKSSIDRLLRRRDGLCRPCDRPAPECMPWYGATGEASVRFHRAALCYFCLLLPRVSPTHGTGIGIAGDAD